MKEPKYGETGKHECDNCGKIWPAGKLADIRHYSQRVDPGGTVPSGECPSCGALCYPWAPSPNSQLYLVHNRGGVELKVAVGPFSATKAFERALIQFVGGKHFNLGGDTLHKLKITGGKPELSDLPDGYYENVLWVAMGREGRKPKTWDQPGLALATRKEFERKSNSRKRGSCPAA